jgi:BlaI family transcriptional regulator, penicillinase repressor
MRKARATREIPPPLELQCLSALWSLGEGQVKNVQQFLAGTRPLAYTTIMTVLDRLARRNLITRRKAGRAFVYSPAVSRDVMRRLALQEFLDSYFESSPARLLEFLLDQPRGNVAVSSSLDPALL